MQKKLKNIFRVNENTIKQYYWIKPHSYRLWVFYGNKSIVKNSANIFHQQKQTPFEIKRVTANQTEICELFYFLSFLMVSGHLRIYLIQNEALL